MIQEVTMYQVICDNCKAPFEDEFMGHVAWTDGSSASYVATESGWLEVDGKHYCDDCFHYGDNDEPQIDSSRTKI